MLFAKIILRGVLVMVRESKYKNYKYKKTKWNPLMKPTDFEPTEVDLLLTSKSNLQL